MPTSRRAERVSVIDGLGCGITQAKMQISELRVCVWVGALSLQVAACSGATDAGPSGVPGGSSQIAGSAGDFAAGGAPTNAAGSSSGAPAVASAGSGGSASGTTGTGGAIGTASAGGSAIGTAGAGGGATGAAGAGGRANGAAGAGSAGSAGSSATLPGPAQEKPTGYGQGTTGGGKSKAVTVATFAALQAAIDGYSGSGGLVLEYTGKFDFASIKDPCLQHTLPAQTIQIKSKSNITISGAAGSSANFGFHIAAAASNVIIRNMTIGLLPGGDASDMISIEGMSGGVPKNIWIDHNELFSSLAVCAGAGDTAFDGMLDIKKGGDLITVSYNYLHDHQKVSLNGYTDGDDALRQITFHHNWFENVGSRLPLQRHGYSHVVNNFFSKVQTSGINVRMGGYALIEGNYFEHVKNPVTSRDSEAVGFWDLRSNNLTSAADVAPGNKFGITWDEGNSGTVNATAWTTTAAFPIALGYPLTAQPAQCVHDGLPAVAGANKGLATLQCK
jgi:pectate lyase